MCRENFPDHRRSVMRSDGPYRLLMRPLRTGLRTVATPPTYPSRAKSRKSARVRCRDEVRSPRVIPTGTGCAGVEQGGQLPVHRGLVAGNGPIGCGGATTRKDDAPVVLHPRIRGRGRGHRRSRLVEVVVNHHRQAGTIRGAGRPCAPPQMRTRLPSPRPSRAQHRCRIHRRCATSAGQGGQQD